MIACAKDMQPVAILRFLDVADEAVDAGQRLCRAGAGIKAEVLFNPAALRLGSDVRDQPVAPRRVQPVRGRVFIQQPFQPSECIGQFRCHQRGRHMAYGHGPDTAFGLRGLTGVIDDKGIDHRHRADQRLGPAGVRQGDGFARQPFQRAMGPDMHHRIRLLLQPQIEGDIARARRAAQVVIVIIPFGQRPAFGLQGDQQLATAQRRKTERPVVKQRIILRRAPAVGQVIAQRLWQLCKRGLIRGHRPAERFGAKTAGNRLRIGKVPRIHVIALRRQLGRHLPQRCQRIQPQRMSHVPVFAGVGGQHHPHRL